MNKQNLIKIEGGSYKDIKKALKQWIMTNSDELVDNIKFELYKTGQESCLIAADKRLNNEYFDYLINYLRYPDDIKYSISIEGYTTVRDENAYSKNFLNKKVIVYIPDNDKEYDNVFLTTEDNETYKVDFSGNITQQNESKTFFIPEFDETLFQRPEKIILNKQELAEIEKEKSMKSLQRRFKIILSLVVLTAIFNSLSLFVIQDNIYIDQSLFILVFSVGLWFCSDYKMLQINKYYLYCFMISIVLLLYGLLIKEHLSEIDRYAYSNKFYFPVIYLIIQKPLRLFFIRKFEREPIINRDSSFLDTVYGVTIIILTLGMISAISNLT